MQFVNDTIWDMFRVGNYEAICEIYRPISICVCAYFWGIFLRLGGFLPRLASRHFPYKYCCFCFCWWPVSKLVCTQNSNLPVFHERTRLMVQETNGTVRRCLQLELTSVRLQFNRSTTIRRPTLDRRPTCVRAAELRPKWMNRSAWLRLAGQRPAMSLWP